MRWNIQNSSRSGLWGLVFATAVIALYGCNPAQTEQATPTDSPQPEWKLNLTINGGMAGQSRSISIDHQGVTQFTDHIRKTQKNGQIPVTDLNKLAELVNNYSAGAVNHKGKQNACRDCFIYTINIEYDGKVSRQTLNDLNMDENSQRLIGALKKISSAHTHKN